MIGKRVVIQLQRDAGCRREWLAEYRGKRYRADSYPDSELIYLATAAGRKLSAVTASKLSPLISAAIAKALDDLGGAS